MTNTRIGIIGASAKRGWAKSAHIPAIERFPEFELTAVSASSQANADAAAAAYDAQHAFDNAHALASCPDVDLVVICVKVETHLDLVTTALNAGKDVYCEWPLGANLEEAETLYALAQEKQARHFIGLQARSAPPLRYLHDLIKGGHIGNVLSSSMIASGMQWGATTDKVYLYLNDRSKGGTMTTVPMGHTIDVIRWTLGEFDTLAVAETTHFPTPINTDTNEPYTRDAADDIAICGKLQNGAIASVHYRGGTSRGENMLWEIKGTKGELQVRAGSGHLQNASATLFGATDNQKELAQLDVPSEYILDQDLSPGAPYNLAHVYARLARAYRGEEHGLPTFKDAVEHHILLDRIEKAAR